ncbi:MAG: hypothetical protein QOI89_3062 [Solirubrobacteraceae bacterium]|nr:hypothetical protein [Solirubrobacteraceae bacterium]
MTSPVPSAPVISADAAGRVLCDYFLANADRGDHTANDALVAELVRRMRVGQTCSGGASEATSEAAVLHHRPRGGQ